MTTLLLIDGHAVIHRAFHALPPMRSKNGTPTNAVYGFFTMLHKALIDFQPTHLAVCFDTPKPTFRKELFTDYQAKRPPMDDNLKPQIQIIKDILDGAKVVRAEQPGFEADDVIGTLATTHKKSVDRVLIMTGDRDILQLSDTNVFVVTPQAGFSQSKIYNPEGVKEKFGVRPDQIPDYKALAGDASDNYNTAKGIGPKTAAMLLNQFDTIENLLNNIDSVEKPKLRDTLTEYKDTIILFKKIATIVTNVDLELTLDQLAFTTFAPGMKEELEKYQLFGLVQKLLQPTKIPEPVVKKEEVKKIPDESQIGLF